MTDTFLTRPFEASHLFVWCSRPAELAQTLNKWLERASLLADAPEFVLSQYPQEPVVKISLESAAIVTVRLVSLTVFDEAGVDFVGVITQGVWKDCRIRGRRHYSRLGGPENAQMGGAMIECTHDVAFQALPHSLGVAPGTS